MRISRFERAVLLMLLALLGSAWIVYSRQPVTASRNILLTEAPIVGHLAPDFTLESPDGDAFSLVDYVDRENGQGRPVVLNFWASWCAPCRIEMPHLQNASLKYREQVAFLGVNQGEPARTVTDFRVSYGLTYPLLVDQESSVSNLYSVFHLPTTIFIDKDGIVREVFIGVLNQGVLEDRISRLLEDSG